MPQKSDKKRRPIAVPASRAFLLPSANEPERLLCWLPPNDLVKLANAGRISSDVPKYYPHGLEIRVCETEFDEYGLDLGVSPEEIKSTFAEHVKKKKITAMQLVSGRQLVSLAKKRETWKRTPPHKRPTPQLPPLLERVDKPMMSRGRSPLSIVHELQLGKKVTP